jgi:putative ABC transport system substrate-binding protein
MRRREFLVGIGGTAAVWPLAARAQKSLPRIGWLVFGDAKKMGPVDQSLKDALVQAGLLDGRNIEIVFRYANGRSDRLALSAELIAQKPDLLLAVGGPVVMPLFEARRRRTHRWWR